MSVPAMGICASVPSSAASPCQAGEGAMMMIALTMMLAALAAHPAQVSGTDPGFFGWDPQPRTDSESPKKNNPTLSSQRHPTLPILAVILQLNRFQLGFLSPELLPSFRRRLSSSMTKFLGPSAANIYCIYMVYIYLGSRCIVCSSFGFWGSWSPLFRWQFICKHYTINIHAAI